MARYKVTLTAEESRKLEFPVLPDSRKKSILFMNAMELRIFL